MLKTKGIVPIRSWVEARAKPQDFLDLEPFHAAPVLVISCKIGVAEARALGADCILIIMASVSDAQAAELEACAQDWGMDALIEVHDRPELDRALRLQSPLIGVNNRNLKTFETTLDTTRDLAAHVPPGRLLISESGLNTPADLASMAASGARVFLIGESLMRQTNVEDATRTLLKDPVPA